MCLCRCVPVYKHACPPTCVHVCKWAHTCLHDTHDCAHTCLCLHTQVYACAHTCRLVHMHAHMYLFMCACLSTMLMCICACVCWYMCCICMCVHALCLCACAESSKLSGWAQLGGTISTGLQCSNRRFYWKFLCLWLFPFPFSAAGSAVHPPSLHSPGSFVRTTLNISTVTHWSVTGFGHFF